MNTKQFISFCLLKHSKQLQLQDIFNLVKSFFNTNDIPLQAIGTIRTDSAPTMPGNPSRFVTFMKKRNFRGGGYSLYFSWSGSGIKHLPVTLNSVMDSCIKIVNYILGRALNYG